MNHTTKRNGKLSGFLTLPYRLRYESPDLKYVHIHIFSSLMRDLLQVAWLSYDVSFVSRHLQINCAKLNKALNLINYSISCLRSIKIIGSSRSRNQIGWERREARQYNIPLRISFEKLLYDSSELFWPRYHIGFLTWSSVKISEAFFQSCRKNSRGFKHFFTMGPGHPGRAISFLLIELWTSLISYESADIRVIASKMLLLRNACSAIFQC